MIFKNPREVFAQNKPFYQNLFQFIHMCHIFEGTNPYMSPIFQQFGQIFRAKVDLTGQVIAEKWRVYFTKTTARSGWSVKAESRWSAPSKEVCSSFGDTSKRRGSQNPTYFNQQWFIHQKTSYNFPPILTAVIKRKSSKGSKSEQVLDLVKLVVKLGFLT